MKIKHTKQKCCLNLYVFQQQLQTVFQLHNYVQYYKYLFHKMYFKVTLAYILTKQRNKISVIFILALHQIHMFCPS